ncbi:MAG: hypothetical protein IJS52_01940 [Bacilli bacterium]|nr:hypothetical protein [Bacilli bacterium]
MKKVAILLAAMLLTACGSSSSATSHPTGLSTGGTPASSQAAAAISYADATDAEGIESGMYLHGKYVYDLNKADKKLTCYDFGMDYNKLKAKEGTKVFDVAINFVVYGEHGNAIHFVAETKDHYLYVSTAGKIAEDLVTVDDGQYSISSSFISTLPTFVEPRYGSYVSDKEFKQDKVDAEGKRIENSEGGYEKETFYLFLDLTATSAKIYVGENNQTHRDTPLHEIENYGLTYNPGGLAIKIPHKDGEFSCTLTVVAENTISFNNAYEKHGDYSAAGKFVLMEK